ncbi:hypothetical protein [Nocardioides sp.]|uniref:hypothetical protein n=1 Tax=Nocardioides sp. TaxID=35761 RepID=UPI002ED795C5
MSDLTPPPEEPLSDQSRARIRQELLRSTRDEPGARARWLVPAVAAAAVVAVAGLGAWSVQGGDEASPAAPATSTSPTPPPLPAPDASTPVPPPIPDPTGVHQVGRGTCREEVANVLPRPRQVVTFPADGGATSFWESGDDLSLCDERGGVTTVHKPVSMSRSDGVAPFRVSTVLERVAGGFQVTRVAGGLVPAGMEGVFDVRYTFPDGHTEPATTVQDDQGRTWWRMLYSYDIGSGNEFKQPPITATLSYSGVQKTFSLDWGTDTCAQANHGC